MSSAIPEIDQRWMRTAIDLAAHGLGATWPNPSVGCVLVKHGRMIARAVTASGGRPHAETEAIRLAGPAAHASTAYVSLEPCAHVGRTPPCADALIAAGVTRVVVACPDPDPRVSGRGIQRLRAAGIEVVEGVLRREAERDHAGFFSKVRRGRPLVSLKLATSMDGRIATSTGASQWITGPDARSFGHRMRATHDAIMVGSGTGLADDPALTCRLPGLQDRSPVRVVLDARLRLAVASTLAQTAWQTPTWLFTAPDHDRAKARVLINQGVRIEQVPAAASGGVALVPVLARLAERGITRLLVEGGAVLAASLMREHLVDRLYFFRAPLLIGGDGVAGLAPFGVRRLEDAGRWQIVGERRLDGDRLVELDALGHH
ncbi:MAG TPA: bifunctional diaminohydroxyphosphoribosylaminopyrimidine deaminase/5-amino-6-(5-phosphoribosylamino)uracil reductase RibD [Geminicoccus sp.]|uniref:bifunctional diaminohydroxyphosphoribosylaminopyrimidine deaminase/5-amino-6-(5-phosphoribosylamino)uracil reductase RibD n=1 Tax=Geminicoccus sp. TaxID=2024832 RepID=UPI002E36EF6A|nr:bifunctional diaminohydroxyphosphoribosylaminopyrimidine deaminase/5-amino-6-(5-phosphoribosylamino)uracil reductase RibD [Geminicoccus sp.]HEX2525491.1 bifunctional diaminohydroxyphosphoribosylaminopyrimidine deaminase/5-amino-6-(5-phosphoribosylamino)uracil reductase RibD [Geminicoccus sp.]